MSIFDLKKSKILVAGGTGFLGKRVIKRLKKEGIKYASTSLSTGIDFRDKKQTENYFRKEKPDIVINCATFTGGIKFCLDREGEVIYNNVLINTNLIEAARKYNVKRFINPISNCSYPDVIDQEFKEEEWWNGPFNKTVLAYGFVRKTSWVQLYAYYNQYHFESSSFIIPNMYGPDDHFDEIRSHALGALIKKIITAKENNQSKVVVWGSGKPIREWMYVDDCVEVLMKSLLHKSTIEPVNIGQGKGISISELANIITQIVEYKGKLIYDLSKPDGAPYKVMNISKMKSIFKQIPETPLKSGIEKTINWYYRNKIKSK